MHHMFVNIIHTDMFVCMQVNNTSCKFLNYILYMKTDIGSDVFHEAGLALCFIVERNSILEVGCWINT